MYHLPELDAATQSLLSERHLAVTAGAAEMVALLADSKGAQAPPPPAAAWSSYVGWMSAIVAEGLLAAATVSTKALQDEVQSSLDIRT